MKFNNYLYTKDIRIDRSKTENFNLEKIMVTNLNIT